MRYQTKRNGVETTAEDLLNQPSQESFNHDSKGEIWGGQSNQLGKAIQIF